MKNKFNFVAWMFASVTTLGVTGCTGNTGMQNSNTDYGSLVASHSAGADFTKEELQAQFVPNVACRGTISATESNDLAHLTMCEVNRLYLRQDPIFGMNGRSVNDFVTSTNPEITNISREQLIYTSPGSPYISSGGAVAKETVSGLVLYPKGIATNQIKGIIIYYHPTVVSKAGVPSGVGNGTDPVNIASSTYTQELLASIYANAGYIVVAPDYIGQGINADVVHPYVLLPKSSALSGIYMLPALKEYLANKGISLSDINGGKPHVFISSYSEGGAYALWASYLVQNGYQDVLDSVGVTLKRTVGVSGAYNLTGAMVPFAFANVNNAPSIESNPYQVSPGCDPDANFLSNSICGDEAPIFQSLEQVNIASSKPVLGSYMVNALITYMYTPVAYKLTMVPEFADQVMCVNPNSVSLTAESYQFVPCSAIFGKQYTVQQLFLNNGLNASQIAGQLVAAAVGSSYNNAFLIGSHTGFIETAESMINGNYYNSISSIIYPQLLDDEGVMDHIGAANIYDWKTTLPISLVFMKYDSTVTNKDSYDACSTASSSLKSNSVAGMVNCITDGSQPGVNNTNLWEYSGEAPLYLSHGNAEGILQLVALHEIESAVAP